jgi:hypothetical protein
VAGPIEEIGARFTVLGAAKARAEFRSLMGDVQTVAKTTVAADEQIIASNRAMSAAQAEVTAKSAAYAEARAKHARMNSLAAEQESGAVKDAMVLEARAFKVTADAARVEATAARVALTATREARNGIVLANTEIAASAEASASRFAASMAKMAKVGKVVTLGLIAGAGLIGYHSVKAAMHFETAMTLVNTMAGVSKDRIASLSAGLLKMAPGVAAGPTALADALYRIASANSGLGATNDQLLAMTKAAGQLNMIGGGNDSTLGETARVLGGVKASNIEGAGGYQKIVSLAAATVGSGDMKMGDFIAALGTGVLPAAHNFSVKLPDVGALLSVLTDNLIPGSTAGSVMTHMFSLLGAPSGVGQKAFRAIGLNPTDLNYAMRDKGLIPAIGMLRDHLAMPQTGAAAGSGPAEQDLLSKFGFTGKQITQIMTKGADKAEQAVIMTKAFGGAKQSVPIVTAVGEYPRLVARQAQIAKQSSPENAQKIIATSKATFANQIKTLESALQVLEIRIGNRLIPILMSLGHQIKEVVRWFEKHKTTAEALAIAVGTVLTIAIAAYTVAMVQAAIATVAATWPVLAVIAVVALLAAGIYLLWTKWDSIWNWISHHKGLALVIGLVLLIVAPIVLVGVVLVAMGKHWETVWRVVKAIVGFMGLAFVTLGQVLYYTLMWPLKVMLEAMGHVPGFGWAKGAADQIGKVGKALDDAKQKLMDFTNAQLHPIVIPVVMQLDPALHAKGFIGPTVAEGLASQHILGPYAPKTTGARALGGPVTAGMPYLVGEHGPEMVIPQSNGNVRTASDTASMMGRGTVNIHAGAIVINESQNPQKTYEAAKRGISDALARK